MHGTCAPPPCPPPCPPQQVPETLGDWGGQAALDDMYGEYAQQSTNASGLDDTVPGIVIDDSELGLGEIDGGGGGGGSSVVESILEYGDLAIPAVAGIAASTGIIGLAALGAVIQSIHKNVKKAKYEGQRIETLIKECVDLESSIKKAYETGVQRNMLEKDITNAMKVLVKIDAHCKKMVKANFIKQVIKASQREREVEALQREFDSMRSNLTTISTLKILQILRVEIAPALDGVHRKLDRISSQTQLQNVQSTQVTSTETTTTTKTTSTVQEIETETTKRSSKKKKARKEREEAEQEDDLDERYAQRDEYGYAEEQRGYEYDSHQEYDSRQQYGSRQEYDSRHEYQGYETQQDYDSRQYSNSSTRYSPHPEYDSSYPQPYPSSHPQTWYPHEAPPQQHDYDWQQPIGDYYDDSQHTSSSSSYHPPPPPTYTPHPSAHTAHLRASQMEANARGMEARARGMEQKARAMELKASHMQMRATGGASEMHQLGAAMSNMSVSSWGSGGSVYPSVDNSMHDNRSMHYGNVVNTTTFNR